MVVTRRQTRPVQKQRNHPSVSSTRPRPTAESRASTVAALGGAVMLAATVRRARARAVASTIVDAGRSPRLDLARGMWTSVATLAVASSSCVMDSARARARAHRARINRALYRAKQRGFLELDIMVGEWASREMRDPATTSEAFLDAFDDVLDVENPDLFKWLTGQAEAPLEVRENEAYASLARHCKKFLDEKSDEASRAAHGREWIRGWNDGAAGNQ